ncbi:MAG: 6-phosphofructokinase [Nitrospirae bacterium]|nr:MAG: 6-phosphofructokinase [Nitrospirota bacterium]
MPKKERLGIIVGGGPAPGINGVISSAVIEAVNEGHQVLGIRGGFKSLFDGDLSAAIPLTIDDVSRIHAQGGSILRTSREYPDRVKEKFKKLMETLKRLQIRYLLTIGGEGTLFMANWIEREGKGKISVIHVPKTIDNDIALPGGVPTFGYETARHYGVQITENLMEDAKTTGRWYFVTAMGRHAGHLALGIGKAAGATVTLIAEEFPGKKISLKKVSDILTGSIIKRLSMNRDHGVAILAEGISEKFDLDELSRYEKLEKDETGRVRLSEIQLGRVLKNFVKKNLDGLGIKITIVDKNIGYELRCADPIPFDVEYTRNLGYGAVKAILSGSSGFTIVFYDGRLKQIPFDEMFEPDTGRSVVRVVDVCSENYEVGRKYMIRLETEDLKDPSVKKLAQVSKIPVKAFAKRFEHIFS